LLIGEIPIMRTIVLAIFSLFTATAALAVPSHLYYTGLINNKLAVQMDLAFAKTAVSGQYAYDSIGEELEVKGTWTKAGAIALKEHLPVEYGKPRFTGRITGSFSGVVSVDRRQISGQWRSADGKRALPFTLRAVAEYRTHTVAHRYLRKNTIYPQFLDPAPAWSSLNKQLYGIAMTAEKAFHGIESEQ